MIKITCVLITIRNLYRRVKRTLDWHLGTPKSWQSTIQLLLLCIMSHPSHAPSTAATLVFPRLFLHSGRPRTTELSRGLSFLPGKFFCLPSSELCTKVLPSEKEKISMTPLTTTRLISTFLGTLLVPLLDIFWHNCRFIIVYVITSL